MTGLAVRTGHRTATCSRQQAEKRFSALALPHAYRQKPDLTKRVLNTKKGALRGASLGSGGWIRTIGLRVVSPTSCLVLGQVLRGENLRFTIVLRLGLGKLPARSNRARQEVDSLREGYPSRSALAARQRTS